MLTAGDALAKNLAKSQKVWLWMLIILDDCWRCSYEAWYGHKPSLSFLKVFGCLCFTHVPQIKRDKLDKRALPGIFIGYSTVEKAYKIFQPQTGKIVISRDVHFVEDEEWN